MPVRFPLSTLLSHVLVAFTVELDNAFERRLRDSGQTPRVTSFVMWANFMRCVGDGITVAELPDATGIPKARTLSTLGGMERWRYVSVGPNSETRRDGSGSGRGLRPDWVVRPTAAGRAAAAIWRPLADEIEERWVERFGAAAVGELRLSLEPIARRPELALPEYIPIVGGANWTVVDAVSGGTCGDASQTPLSALLSRALLAYALEFEREAGLALPLSANLVRVLDERSMNVEDVARRGGISKEAVAMATTFLAKHGYVATEEKAIRLTAIGGEAQTRAGRRHCEIDARWPAQTATRLRAALTDLLERKDLLALGLRPEAGGWRGSKPYLAQTEAMLADPTGRLPHYPMVLHRGGWTDGS
jgi:hypothetical protein